MPGRRGRRNALGTFKPRYLDRGSIVRLLPTLIRVHGPRGRSSRRSFTPSRSGAVRSSDTDSPEKTDDFARLLINAAARSRSPDARVAGVEIHAETIRSETLRRIDLGVKR